MSVSAAGLCSSLSHYSTSFACAPLPSWRANRMSPLCLCNQIYDTSTDHNTQNNMLSTHVFTRPITDQVRHAEASAPPLHPPPWCYTHLAGDTQTLTLKMSNWCRCVCPLTPQLRPTIIPADRTGSSGFQRDRIIEQPLLFTQECTLFHITSYLVVFLHTNTTKCDVGNLRSTNCEAVNSFFF